MANGLMVPHSFPGLLENTWPGISQWSTLVLHHTCRRQQSRQVLQLSRLLFARLPNMHCCLYLMCLSPLPSKLLGETNFLLQHLSICVQRHNAIAFRGTFQDGREAWDEA